MVPARSSVVTYGHKFQRRRRVGQIRFDVLSKDMDERCTRKRNFSSLSPFFNHRLPKSVHLDLRKTMLTPIVLSIYFLN